MDAIETHKRWLDQRMAGWLVAGVPEPDRQTERWAFSRSLFPFLFFPLLSSLVLTSLAVVVAVAQFCITTHLSNHKRKRNTNQVSPLTHYWLGASHPHISMVWIDGQITAHIFVKSQTEMQHESGLSSCPVLGVSLVQILPYVKVAV